MVPEGWRVATLEALTSKSVSYGIVQTGDPNVGDVPCVRVVDLVKKQISPDNLITTTHEISRSYKKTILEPEEIMLALRGEIGLVRMVATALVGCNLTRGIARIAADRTQLEPQYLLWALRSSSFRRHLMRRVNGSALQEIPLGELKKVPLLVPPLREQSKISEILSAWDRAIETVEKLIEYSEQQRNALIHALLGSSHRLPAFRRSEWRSVSLASIVDLSKERVDPKKSTESRRCIELEHIQSETGALIGECDSAMQDSIKAVFHPGDVLFGKLRPYLRKYHLPEFQGVCSTEIWVLRPKSSLRAAYLYYLVQTSTFSKAANVSSGSKMPRAAWSVVRDATFRIPELGEQDAIVSVLQTADALVRDHEAQRQLLIAQRTALMQQLLTGKRRVKVHLPGKKEAVA